MKIRTRGRQAFNVPNDQWGRLFVHLMRKFINRQGGWSYRRRGRGPRHDYMQGHASPDAPDCKWAAVYLERKTPPAPPPNAIRENWDYLDAVQEAGGLGAHVHTGVVGQLPRNNFELNNLMFQQSEGTGVPMEPAVEFLAAGGIFRIRVADWSNVILAGEPVALLNGEAIHTDHDAMAPVIGVATGSQQFEDNLGFALVNVRLENQLDASTVTRVDDEGIHVAADEVYEVLGESDEVALTPDEQKLLADILKGVTEGYYFEEKNLAPEALKNFHSLVNKLVD